MLSTEHKEVLESTFKISKLKPSKIRKRNMYREGSTEFNNTQKINKMAKKFIPDIQSCYI